MTLTSKYDVGAVVYQADVSEIIKPVPCPDCKETQKWEAHTPAGEVLEFACPRCTGWRHDGVPRQRAVLPVVTRMTIGSIRFDTHDGKVEYMCVETGVGSGTIHDESRLCESQESAEKVAASLCAARLLTVEKEQPYQAAALAAECTFTSLAIEKEKVRRRQYQFRLEDVQSAVFSDITDAELREQLRRDLETIS